MTKRELRNAIAIMVNIDWPQVDWMSRSMWEKFRQDPWRTYMRLDEENEEKVWRIIDERLKKCSEPQLAV